MENTIEIRREFSDRRFQNLKDLLEESSEVCQGKACVYATGSFGRREASKHSDIDLFIVSRSEEVDKIHDRKLKGLDEILVKADLIKASKKLEFPPFSGEGRWLHNHAKGRLIEATGGQNDDSENTFTARLLLLLESRPLICPDVHSEITDEVIARYWQEYPQYADCFMPAFLANDILRYWRTLCLNYEANIPTDGPNIRAKRRVNNYKLKHSRMLTCYSALIFLLHIFTTKNTVTIEEARRMVTLTPTQRIEYVAQEAKFPGVINATERLLVLYGRFLDVTNDAKDSLYRRFSDEKEARDLKKEQSQFGDHIFEILHGIGIQNGEPNRFYRRLVV